MGPHTNLEESLVNFKTTVKLIFYVILIACFSQSVMAGKGKDGQSGRLIVMTQNLYVGANLFKILAGEPGDVPLNAAEIFSDIQTTDFQQRADLRHILNH